MFTDISSFLSRFEHLTPPERSIKKAFQHVVKELLGVTIHEREISIRSNVVYINTNPTLKSEIVINKALILRALSEKLSNTKRPVDDVR